VMANSLHFLDHRREALTGIHAMIRPGGRLVLVEYDTDRGNPWIPFPLSLRTWQRLAADAGFQGTRQLGRVPSRHGGAIYSALSYR